MGTTSNWLLSVMIVLVELQWLKFHYVCYKIRCFPSAVFYVDLKTTLVGLKLKLVRSFFVFRVLVALRTKGMSAF